MYMRHLNPSYFHRIIKILAYPLLIMGNLTCCNYSKGIETIKGIGLSHPQIINNYSASDPKEVKLPAPDVAHRIVSTKIYSAKELNDLKFIFQDKVNVNKLDCKNPQNYCYGFSAEDEANYKANPNNYTGFNNYLIEIYFKKAKTTVAKVTGSKLFASDSSKPTRPAPKYAISDTLACEPESTTTLVVIQNGIRDNRHKYIKHGLSAKGFGEILNFQLQDFYIIDAKQRLIYPTAVEASYDDKTQINTTNYTFPINCLKLAGGQLVWQNIIMGGEKQQPIHFDLRMISGDRSYVVKESAY